MKNNVIETKPGEDDSYLRDCLPAEENENTCKTEEGAEEGVVRNYPDVKSIIYSILFPDIATLFMFY